MRDPQRDPQRDPLADLRDLRLATSPLPPHEVRRRGDRMRRRRTALQALAAAAAVATIASGGAVVTSGVTGAEPPAPLTQPTGPPATPDTTTPDTTTPDIAVPDTAPPGPATSDPAAVDAMWSVTVPEPLRRTLRESLPALGEDGPGHAGSIRLDEPWRGLPCGAPRPLGPVELPASTFGSLVVERLDQHLEVVGAPGGGYHAHQVVLYEDATTAGRAVEAILRSVRRCGPVEAIPSITELRYAERPLDLAGRPSWLITGGEFDVATGGRGTTRTLTALTRVGNAVVALTLADESSAPLGDLTEPGTARLLGVTERVVDQMCAARPGPCTE